MKFEYTGRHINVTPALKRHVEEHFERLDHLFETKPTHAHVTIEVERGRHRSEITLKWRREVLNAATTNADMYQSLSQTIAKLEKQALKIKNKLIDKTQRVKKSGLLNSESSENGSGDGKPRIYNARRYAVKPMTPDEASIVLQSRPDSFLVFRKAEDEKIAVLYKRKDGNFGLIQP